MSVGLTRAVPVTMVQWRTVRGESPSGASRWEWSRIHAKRGVNATRTLCRRDIPTDLPPENIRKLRGTRPTCAACLRRLRAQEAAGQITSTWVSPKGATAE